MKRAVTVFMLGLLVFITGGPAAAGMLTMETPHFNIHFQAGEEQPASKVAEIAEDIHVVLTERAGYTPAGRTEIHLLSTSDFANGFAGVTYYNKMGIYLVYPAGWMDWTLGVGMKAESWLRLVLTHEYAHVLHLDMHRGAVSVLRRVFGRIPFLATPNFTMSTAYIEGYAVYEETVNTAGGRGADPYYEMFLRTAVLEDTVPTFDQMLGLYDLDDWQPSRTAYLYGWSLVDYIARRYGEEKLAAMNKYYSGWSTIGLFQVLARSLGVSATVLWREWRRDLEERYRAQAAELKAGGLTPLEELTGPVMAAKPAFSPDGTSLAYVTLGKKDYFPGLYLYDLTTGRERLLVEGQITSGRLAWSPCGRRLVYGKADYVDGDRLYNDLYLYDLDREKETRLTRGARAGDPAWSPAGDRLVYVARDNLDTSLLEYNPVTGQSRVLRRGRDETQFFTPVFSPDGKQLAVGVWQYGGYQGIAVMDSGGAGFRFLLCDRANNRNPVFTPGGDYILFDSDRDGAHNIYAYELAAGRLWKLTNTLTGLFAPAPSPDGEELVLMSYTAAGYRLVRTARDNLRWEEAPCTVATTPAPPAVTVGKYPVRPYNPLPTLLPKYWLPSSENDAGGGWRLGVMTGGMDAVERHGYGLYVSHGFTSGKPNFTLDYWYDPPGRAVFSMYLDAVTEQAAGWRDRYTLDARLGFAYPGLLAGRVFFSGIRVEHCVPYAEGTVATAGMLYGGWIRQENTGKGPAGFQQKKLLTAGLRTAGQKTGCVGEGYWQGFYTLRGAPRVEFKLSAGLAQFPGYYALGGHRQKTSFPGNPETGYVIRGFAPGVVRGAGFVLINTDVYPVRFPVERGFRDIPIFLRQVRGGLFLDAGFAGEEWRFAESGSAVSAGAEIRLTTDFFYGSPGFDWRLGIAWPLHPVDGCRLYLTVSSEF